MGNGGRGRRFEEQFGVNLFSRNRVALAALTAVVAAVAVPGVF